MEPDTRHHCVWNEGKLTKKQADPDVVCEPASVLSVASWRVVAPARRRTYPECGVNVDKDVEVLTVRAIPNFLDTCGDLTTVTWQQDIARARPGNKAMAFVDSEIRNTSQRASAKP